MHTFIRRALIGTLLAGGITLLGATVANAAETTGEDGLLSGNQALVDITAPISVVDNAVSVIGDSTVVNPATGNGSGNHHGRTRRGTDHERGRRHRVRQPGSGERRRADHGQRQRGLRHR